MFRLGLNRGGILRHWNRQTGWEISGRDEEAAIGRHAADADELSGLAGKGFGDNPYAPVGRDHNVEGSPGDRRVERFAEMGVRMDVRNIRSDLGYFVRTAMKYRNRIAAIAQAIYEKRSAGTGTTDYQSALHLKFLICDQLMAREL